MKDGEAIRSDTPLPNCTGFDTSTLLISSFADEHEGSFTCVVRNEDNSLESNSADLEGEINLTMISMTCLQQRSYNYLTLSALTIRSHPLNINEIYGRSVTMCTSATGPGTLSYLWIKDEKKIVGDTCLGVNTSTMQITCFTSEHDGQYTCIVCNEHCTLESCPGKLQGKMSKVPYGNCS